MRKALLAWREEEKGNFFSPKKVGLQRGMRGCAGVLVGLGLLAASFVLMPPLCSLLTHLHRNHVLGRGWEFSPFFLSLLQIYNYMAGAGKSQLFSPRRYFGCAAFGFCLCHQAQPMWTLLWEGASAHRAP